MVSLYSNNFVITFRKSVDYYLEGFHCLKSKCINGDPSLTTTAEHSHKFNSTLSINDRVSLDAFTFFTATLTIKVVTLHMEFRMYLELIWLTVLPGLHKSMDITANGVSIGHDWTSCCDTFVIFCMCIQSTHI